MFTKQQSDKASYGIVGLGRFGQALASELATAGVDLLVLDEDEEKVREMRELTDNALVVKGLDKKSLLETGIQNCDVAVVCIGEKIDASILATLNLISFGIPKVISKAASSEQGEVLEKLGAEVVFPERDMAVRLGKRLETGKMLDYIHLSEQLNISKMFVPEKLINKKVKEINLRSRFGLNIIAIESQGNIIEVVSPDYIFQKKDILFLAGNTEGFLELTSWANS